MIELMPSMEEEEVLQNVRMLTGVVRGEVPFERAMGVDTRLLDAPIRQVQTLLTAELTEGVPKYEPRARVTGLRFEGDEAGGHLEPIIELEVGT